MLHYAELQNKSNLACSSMSSLQQNQNEHFVAVHFFANLSTLYDAGESVMLPRLYDPSPHLHFVIRRRISHGYRGDSN